MIKRIISALLIICLTFSTSATVFAQDTRSTYIPNEQGKSVSYIGEYKLVLWDSGNIVYAEQYNSQGNLIASATANRINGEIITSDAIENNRFTVNDIVETISTEVLPSTYSFNRVGTFTVYHRVDSDRHSMYLYEDIGSAVHTTYSIRTFSGTIAALAVGIAAGIAVPSSIANKIIAAIISAGIGLLSGEILNISTKITLAADKYNLKYYGKDSKTGKTSDTYDKTYKYIITDEESNKINEVYYEGGGYYNPNNNDTTSLLMQYIVPNLYGIDYEWAQ
ncbi:MAG: hypothetical protein SOX11_01915 [Lachnospiraceae bacterium]|nr:hypothetical protein [Lachnospiraceae bacterium]MDY3221885.1 hypothetical protein [Lachnospiraceae bacterium]